MIDTDCHAPTFRAAFDLIPAFGMQRSHLDPDRYDPIEQVVFQPIEWIRVRKFEWHRPVDTDSSYRAAIRLAVVRKIDEPTPPKYRYRIGSLAGQISVPDDFDTMFHAEIEDMFGL